MRGKHASWHEQNGLIEVHWHAAELCGILTGEPIGGTLTPTFWLEQLSLSALKGGLYGSAIREMAVHMLSAFSEMEIPEPSILGRTKISKAISVSLSQSGGNSSEDCVKLAIVLQEALEASIVTVGMLQSDNVVFTVLRGL